MNTRPDCLPCVMLQSLQFARATTDDDFSLRKVLGVVLKELQDTNWRESPAELLESVLGSVRETQNATDPFAALRAESLEAFAGVVGGLRDQAEAAEDSLAFLVTAAAAANLADELVFPRYRDQDLSTRLQDALARGFAKGGPGDLRAALEGVTNVLYLLDNAGEAHVDALLIDALIAQGKSVTVVVRGAGLLHDATREDALAAGFGVLPVVEAPEAEPTPSAEDSAAPAPEAPAPEAGEPGSSDGPTAGAEAEPAPSVPPAPEPEPRVRVLELKPGQLAWPNVSRASDLGAAFDAAGLVIAKGSSYYETFHRDDREVIHLLRAKCAPVADSLGVKQGDLVLIRRTPPPPAEPEPPAAEPPAE